jgi:hypothetical protein
MESINGFQLMVLRNLGLSSDTSVKGAAPVYQNYLHPILFIGVFLPFIWKRWPNIDPRLRALFVIVVPLVFLSSLGFSWLYESRNYVPLLPILLAMVQYPVAGESATVPTSAPTPPSTTTA